MHYLASCVYDGGVVKCFEHALVLARQISKTPANLDRAFYSCDLPLADHPDNALCSFFKWEDELVTAMPATPPTTPRKRPASTEPTPRTPAQQARLDAILSATKEKESEAQVQAGPSSSPPTLTPTPAQQARLDAILSATKGKEREVQAQAGPSSSPPTLTPTPAQQARLDAILSATKEKEREAAAHGLTSPPPTPAQEARLGTILSATKDKGKQKEAQAAAGPSRLRTPPPSWPPHTPPRTAAQPLALFLRRSASPPADPDPHADDNPFLAPSPFPADAAASPTEALTAPAIADWILRTDALNTTLARRLSAAEKSNDAKAQFIVQLQTLIASLEERNAELERRLAG